MNNSLARLIDGMVATLRQELIPQLGSGFARGQAFGLIYMLNSIRLRADWSPEFYAEQLAAQTAFAAALRPLLDGVVDAPELPRAAEPGLHGRALEALRDDNDARICALIDWLDASAGQPDGKRVEAIEMLLRQYMDRQLKWELQTSAKPMFAEISTGAG